MRQAGGKPYPIPAGCSEHPLGGLGFVGFAEEVRQQEAELGFKFDYIVVCSVTGSTQAGMVVGFAADGRADRVIGIDASAKPEQTHAQMLRIARHTAEAGRTRPRDPRQGCRARHPLRRPRVWPAFGRHARGDPSVREAEGMLTDPVYEGKSMQGMIDMVGAASSPKAPRFCMPTWAAFLRSMPTASSSAMAEPAAILSSRVFRERQRELASR